jgi:UDP-N-acetylmuramoyl-tripeptide--D-alanyl-D-alanine ligase
MIELASIVLLYLTFAAFAGKRLMTYMHAYQQEEYDSGRLGGWILKNKAFDKRLTFLLLVCFGTSFFIPWMFTSFLVFTSFAITTYLEKDPRKDSKKKLVFTPRAKRIFFPAYALAALSGLWCFLFPQFTLLWIANVQLMPLWLMAINAILQPYEDFTQQRYWREAYNKIQDYQPTIIGITGSFGKTSVKHILGHILKMNAPTLVTPGSVNTPMGITRIVREELMPEHRYFVVEMGAYGPGSIERLCKLTPPDMGIITAIGHAHYERFKSLETVASAKFELAESVLAKDGMMVVHERTLRFESARAIKDEYIQNFIICGDQPPADKTKQSEESFMTKGDLEIQSIEQRKKGLEVRFIWKNLTHSIEAPLFGVHHGYNVAMAFAAAFELGISARDIQSALSSLPQIQHRLEVKPQTDGTIIIDDAYNSNPVGFQAALGLLTTMGASGRKILITPGMVELGKAHDDAHERIGEVAGQICDVVIVVKGKRIPTFLKGFKSTGASKELHEVDTFSDAQKWVAKNRKTGDVILIENDLPDIYERVPKI